MIHHSGNAFMRSQRRRELSLNSCASRHAPESQDPRDFHGLKAKRRHLSKARFFLAFVDFCQILRRRRRAFCPRLSDYRHHIYRRTVAGYRMPSRWPDTNHRDEPNLRPDKRRNYTERGGTNSAGVNSCHVAQLEDWRLHFSRESSISSIHGSTSPRRSRDSRISRRLRSVVSGSQASRTAARAFPRASPAATSSPAITASSSRVA
jgi:hypothetical protein